jgi:ubiquinone/menaquinone biosynthesis C-methylase UbiE
MLAIARDRVPAAQFVRGDGLALRFADDAFDRVFTAHFYGHLDSQERARFLTARRVAGELVIVDSALRPGVEPESIQERTLQDGSRWTVLKRYFTPEGLAAEVGGGRTLHGGRWFVAVAA